MKNTFYVYAYRDPITNIPFYIGKGTKNRYRDINSRKYNPHLYNKIQKLKKEGYSIDQFTTFEKMNITSQQALLHEMDLIKTLGRKDNGTGVLLNLTDGGDGVVNIVNAPVLLLEKDNIFDLYYNQYKTIKEIADIYKCKSISPVLYLFRLFNKDRRCGGARKPIVDLNKIIEAYCAGKSINQIKTEYRCDHNFIKKCIEKRGIVVQDGRSTSIIRSQINQRKLSHVYDNIFDLYVNQNKSLEYISKIHNTSPDAVRSILCFNNIRIRNNTEAQRIRRQAI